MSTITTRAQQQRAGRLARRLGGYEALVERAQAQPPTSLGAKPPLRNTKFTLLPKITWAEPGGLPECPYFHRWIADFGAFTVRLHHWHGSDDARAFHDHPYSFTTVVLWGGYTDVSPAGSDRLRMGSIRRRAAEYRHTVSDAIPGTWTLLFTSGRKRHWSFWVGDRKVSRDRYFKHFGHHACDPAGEPVRRRPDGSRYETPAADVKR